jgi:hypothetical protein
MLIVHDVRLEVFTVMKSEVVAFWIVTVLGYT